MRLALIAEHFPPMRSSCAVQMRDLALEMRDRGHKVTVLVPAPGLADGWRIEDYEGVKVVRLGAVATQGRRYALRAFGELAMPFLMLRNWRRSKARDCRFDGIVWYSPNIFFGPLVAALKRESDCPAYLILRDIFPEWAADVGVMRKGIAYRLLRQVARYQYSVADVIGVQTPGNLPFFADRTSQGRRVEVLQNWLRPTTAERSEAIDLSATSITGRKVFVYAGNMGVAQGMDRLLRLIEEMRDDERVGFLLVGRGSDVPQIRRFARERNLDNVVFHDEIDPDDIPALYAQSAAGLLALDPRHTWHNIPGKFISYLHHGLPVLASVNPGNDLIGLVHDNAVGRVSVDPRGDDLASLVRSMLDSELTDTTTADRCRDLAREMFAASTAAGQIESALGPVPAR